MPKPLIETLQKVLNELLAAHRKPLILACQQRAKFEGWLKFELACAIQEALDTKPVLETSYSNCKRCDVAVDYDHQTWYIELKTSNTNWRAEGIQNRTRPIKINIDQIIEDIQILQKSAPPGRGIAIFILFPIPRRIIVDEPKKLKYHLERIERECELPAHTLFEQGEYVELTKDFGVCSFVIAVA